MDKSSEVASTPCRGRSKKPNLRSSKPSPSQFSSKTPEKSSQRIRNRGVVLSVTDIRKAGQRLQDRKQCTETSPSSSPPPSKSVRRQISLWPSSLPSKPITTEDESSKLPEKYEILDNFFNSLDNMISLHRLKRWIPTFTSIRPRIESLTDRTFTHGHLAQLKFILPEAIVLKKHLVLNEVTCCMEPDIHISLDPAAVEALLKKVFRARLIEFWESHTESDEIPEGTLPEPFNRRRECSVLGTSETRLPTKLTPCIRYSDIVNNEEKTNVDEKLSVPAKTSVELPNDHLAAASHMAPSFRAWFSQKFKQNGADVQQKSRLDSLQPVESSLKENSPFEDTEAHLKTCPDTPIKTIEYIEDKDGMLKNIDAMSTPARKQIQYTENKDGSLKSIDATSTPTKLVSTPIRLMSATPALRSPKRHYMSPDDSSTTSLNKLARRPPSSRSLKFDTPIKNDEILDEDNAGGLPINDDIFDILQGNLVQSIREKERLAMEEKDPAITQAKKRKKNIGSLPKLFDMIRELLRQRICITKAELISKIVSGRCDIVDRSEVEEQLNLMQELAPEWISEKHVFSGDLLIFINKMSSLETIRASLEKAT